MSSFTFNSKTTVTGTKIPTFALKPLMMSKGQEEKANKKKDRQAMVFYLLSIHEHALRYFIVFCIIIIADGSCKE